MSVTRLVVSCFLASSSSSLVALSGCPAELQTGDSSSGSGASNRQGAACRPLDGIYRFQYRKRTGTCDELPEELLEFRQGRLATSETHNCQAGGAAMVSSCDFQLNRSCSVSDAWSGGLLGMTRVIGTLSETVDNTSVEGTLDFTLVETTGASCMSTFDVTGTRVR